MSTDVSSEDLADEEWEEEAVVEDSVSAASVGASLSREPAGHPLRHIQRDYSYVRSELTRIAVLAAIIVLGLAVVAIIR